jgi:hypothetical protein
MAEGVFPKTDGDVLYASEINTAFYMSPIGSIVAWLKSYTNVPTLPDNWVECNGQTLSDADSVFNGQTIPNLNTGTYRYLRGHSSSGEQINQTIQAHTHTINMSSSTGTSDTTLKSGTGDGSAVATGSYGSTLTQPNSYTVVWIMRIK